MELDYGGLAQYLNKALRDNNEDGLLSDTSIEDVLDSLSGLAAADGLMADTSIEDVLQSLSGLAAADGSLAGQGYERLMSRWRRVQALESAN